MINAEKLMITIFWSPPKIHAIDRLPKGERFNSQSFGQNVLSGRDADMRLRGMIRPV
jgi:hypothetical protein